MLGADLQAKPRRRAEAAHTEEARLLHRLAEAVRKEAGLHSLETQAVNGRRPDAKVWSYL